MSQSPSAHARARACRVRAREWVIRTTACSSTGSTAASRSGDGYMVSPPGPGAAVGGGEPAPERAGGGERDLLAEHGRDRRPRTRRGGRGSAAGAGRGRAARGRGRPRTRRARRRGRRRARTTRRPARRARPRDPAVARSSIRSAPRVASTSAGRAAQPHDPSHRAPASTVSTPGTAWATSEARPGAGSNGRCGREAGAHGSTVTCWTLYQHNVCHMERMRPRVAVLELF